MSAVCYWLCLALVAHHLIQSTPFLPLTLSTSSQITNTGRWVCPSPFDWVSVNGFLKFTCRSKGPGPTLVPQSPEVLSCRTSHDSSDTVYEPFIFIIIINLCILLASLRRPLVLQELLNFRALVKACKQLIALSQLITFIGYSLQLCFSIVKLSLEISVVHS